MTPFGFLLAMALCYGAWGVLGIAMDRHYSDIYGRGAEPSEALRKRLRWAGSLGLVLVFAVTVKMQGWSIGTVACFGVMTMAGILQILALTYRPVRVPAYTRWALWATPVLAVLWLMGVGG